MTLLLVMLSWILLTCGALTCLIGSLGLLRMPDFYTRAHAAGMIDSLGAGLILLGLMLQAGSGLLSLRLLLVALFVLLSSPASTHALVNAARSGGLKVEVHERR